MDKICKTSRIIYKILSVLFWIAIVFTGLAAIGTIAMLLTKDGVMFNEKNTKITLGNFEVTVFQGFSIEQMKLLLAVALVNIIILGAFGCFVIIVLKRIFHPMAQGKPFDSSVSQALRKLAWAVLFYGIISTGLDMITNIVYYRTFNVASLFDSSVVSACTMTIKSDYGFVVWFVLILLLSHIFKYGEELQQLSDETL